MFNSEAQTSFSVADKVTQHERGDDSQTCQIPCASWHQYTLRATAHMGVVPLKFLFFFFFKAVQDNILNSHKVNILKTTAFSSTNKNKIFKLNFLQTSQSNM